MLNALRFIFYSELLLLVRRSQEWVYPLSFFIIVLSFFPITFSTDPKFLQTYLPGCLWLTTLFASLLSTQHLFLAEKEEGALEQLLFSSLPLAIILLPKLTAHWIAHLLPLILITPFVALLFHLSLNSSLLLTLTLLLGTPILLLLGSLSAALTLGLKHQGMLLALITLPLTIPVLVFGINLVHEASAHFSIAAPLIFFASVALFSILLAPLAIGAILRITMED
jgi:heme exporter protein B